MNPTDELRRQIIQEFAPRKSSTSIDEKSSPKERTYGKGRTKTDEPVHESELRKSKKPIDLGFSAIEEVVRKHRELDEISREEKVQARKPLVESADTKLIKEMMRSLR